MVPAGGCAHDPGPSERAVWASVVLMGGSVPQTEEQEAEEPETGKMVPLSGFICPGTAERMVLRMVGRSPAGVAEAAVPSLVSEAG